MFRHLPHTTYGHYGGRKARCASDKELVCPMPIDKMDMAFSIHDLDLRLAKNIKDKVKRKKAIKQADVDLYRNLKLIKNKDLARPIYGRFYKRSALIVFGVASGELQRKGFGFKWLKKF